MPNEQTQATMRDVADAAGVSIATVSHVLNGTRPVAESTVERVRDAVRRLGYEQNLVARSLRTDRTHTLGLIISDIQNPFFTSVIGGVEDYAQAHGFNVFLCNADEDEERAISYVSALVRRQVEGLIIAAQIGDSGGPTLREVSARARHVVFLDREMEGVVSDTVRVDNLMGVDLAVRHLRDLGHSRIGLISGPPDSVSGRERHRGFVSAMSNAGLELSESNVRFGDYRISGGEKAALELLETAPPTSLVVANNLMTLGALRAIRTLDIGIPHELSLIGFDDMDWAPFLNPPLTTVAQPTYELGVEAVRLLIARIEGSEEGEPKAIRMHPQLIVRESTARIGN